MGQMVLFIHVMVKKTQYLLGITELGIIISNKNY
jgi:hypothetical protein